MTTTSDLGPERIIEVNPYMLSLKITHEKRKKYSRNVPLSQREASKSKIRGLLPLP